jgi:hypothetical protein
MHGGPVHRTRGANMDKEELLQLAYIKVAKAAQLLQSAGEELLAEEAEALAEKVDLAAKAAARA